MREDYAKPVTGRAGIGTLPSLSVLGMSPIDSCMPGKCSPLSCTLASTSVSILKKKVNRICQQMICGMKAQSGLVAWKAGRMDGPFSEQKQHSRRQMHREVTVSSFYTR